MKTSRLTVRLAAVVALVVIMVTTVIARAGFLPGAPEEMRQQVADYIAVGERKGLLNLFHWANVDKLTRVKVQQEVDRLFNGKIESIELADIPEGVPLRFSRQGKIYEMNLKPTLMLVVAVEEAKGVAKIGFPLGLTPEGYALAITVPEPRPYQSPTRKKIKLSVRVAADSLTTTEIVCSFVANSGGTRKVISFKGSGSFVENFSGESFDSCAAKKRSGPGITEVSLVQDGSEIFRDRTAKADDPMVYRVQ